MVVLFSILGCTYLLMGYLSVASSLTSVHLESGIYINILMLRKITMKFCMSTESLIHNKLMSTLQATSVDVKDISGGCT